MALVSKPIGRCSKEPVPNAMQSLRLLCSETPPFLKPSFKLQEEPWMVFGLIVLAPKMLDADAGYQKAVTT
jgi:hypothetical protein